MGSAFYFFDETHINRWFWVVTQKCELRVSFNGRDFREQKCFWDKFSQLAGLKTEKFEEIIFVIGSFMWTSRNYLWDGKIWKVSVGDNYEIEIIHIFFFSIRIFFHGHWRLTGQQGKGGDYLLFHATTSTRSRTFRHLQLCMWDDYHIFLIASLVFTRLLLDEIYYRLIELPFDWLMMWRLFLFVYVMIYF